MVAAAIGLLARVASGPTVRCPPGGPCRDQCIFFANHASHLDFIVIWSVLPPELRARTRPVAAKEYWSSGVVRPYVARDVFHAVLVDRDKPTVSDLRAEMEQLTAVLDAGQSLIIFPEGTRATGGEIGRFRGGLDYLARARPDVDLVPVYLDKLQRIMPKGEFLPVPQLSSVTFGAPIHRDPEETKEAFLERARQSVLALKP